MSSRSSTPPNSLKYIPHVRNMAVSEQQEVDCLYEVRDGDTLIYPLTERAHEVLSWLQYGDDGSIAFYSNDLLGRPYFPEDLIAAGLTVAYREPRA